MGEKLEKGGSCIVQHKTGGCDQIKKQLRRQNKLEQTKWSNTNRKIQGLKWKLRRSQQAINDFKTKESQQAIIDLTTKDTNTERERNI